MKRKRIVERMARGLTPRKRRRFPISKIKECFQALTSDEIEQQLHILCTHVILEKPSRSSVGLVENLSRDAENYLKAHCIFNDIEIINLKRQITQLI